MRSSVSNLVRNCGKDHDDDDYDDDEDDDDNDDDDNDDDDHCDVDVDHDVEDDHMSSSNSYKISGCGSSNPVR